MMKILSLNTWHGERNLELQEYLSSLVDEIDIFCLQETNGSNIEKILSALFSRQQFSSMTTTKAVDKDRHYSLTTIVKRPLSIAHSQNLLDDSDIETGHALATTVINDDGETLTVVNVHGIPYVIDDKLDTDGRLRQTEQIITWLKSGDNSPSIICGDFNLQPETQSVKKFVDAGYQNLVEHFAIPTTRNRLAWRHPVVHLFADYTFVSPGLKVTEFNVPVNEVSDHLPMIVSVTS